MQIKPQQLSGALQKNLASVYLISGDEPQQVGELSDLIRTAAKAQDFLSRDIFFADKQFDWKQLNVAANTLSIFADKTLIDLKLTASPGQDGGKALMSYCQRPPEDTLLLITTGKITKETQKSSWFQAIDKQGVIIQVWPLSGQELISWMQARLRQKGLMPESDAVKLLAERVEGNLLAAAQEIEKLYVLYGAGKLTAQQVNDAVIDSSRFDIFNLVESALAEKAEKVLKILASLKEEGIANAVVLWALARETRLLINYKVASTQNEKDAVLRNNGVWGERKQLMGLAA
ncbi:partial DNA polymerase III subunit delta, partial [biofilm metagenome]